MPIKIIRASYEALNTDEKQKNDIGETVALPPRLKVGESSIRSGAISASTIAGEVKARYDGALVNA